MFLKQTFLKVMHMLKIVNYKCYASGSQSGDELSPGVICDSLGVNMEPKTISCILFMTQNIEGNRT